ncbi:MAG: argininosuccinate synthase, partial [Verrucomicrobia bacterium]|nr:argininosuccinate synthase [Verrucomicrobiota bacterium]
TVTRRLMDEGVNVVCFTADLAQADEADIQDVCHRMAPCGAETIVVDCKPQMAEACFRMIMAQATYDGGYWNSTGIARAVTLAGLVPALRKQGCTVLAHGATGRGNDQVRFERYTLSLDPSMKVYAPWRDPGLLAQFPGRKQMADYLNARGIEAFPGGVKRYSTDANLAGLSYEAEDLESLSTPSTIVEPQMGVWPHDAPDTPETFNVQFKAGRAAQINGQSVDAVSTMLMANEIGGRCGVGMKNALENRIIGTKSRGVYESPGMELLATCLRFVYQAILNRKATELINDLSRLVASEVYDGRYYDPACSAALAAIDVLAARATADVSVNLYKGNIYFNSLKGCEASLYNESDSSMEASEGLNPVSSQGFCEIAGVEARALARAGLIRHD